jgi:N-acetylmuramoyl-L-alanine amidase
LTNFHRSHRARRLGTALLVLLSAILPAHARGKPETWASTQFSTAERMRQELGDRTPTEHSRREYQRVISAYRRVYYGAPASAKADPSAFAVAELLAEMGRRLNDDKALRSAIGQYKFLRREYPGSRNRFEALLTIGQIYQDDLKDPDQARPVFEEFLQRYPRHHLAEEARKALAEGVQQAASRSKDEDDSGGDLKTAPGRESAGKGPKVSESKSAAASANPQEQDGVAKLSRVTGIRHWSNPNYTRVSINLERDAKFESQRIDHPQRIVFDLADTDVSSTLSQKNFDVDDGLLKRIRVAQFQPRKTRIVLEVADDSDFDTFLLSDPPRLIVDVHSREIPTAHHQDKGITAKKAVQTASLKEPEAADPEKPISAAAAGTAAAKTPAAGNAVLQIKAASKASASKASAGPARTIVEADDDDAEPIAAAKLDPPEIKLMPKTARPPTVVSPARSSARNKRPAADIAPDVREAAPTASGDRSLIRALGLKIGKIVIDPGHGGHDTGTIGPKGLEEKDLVLDVGRRLGKLLQTRLGADVVYTRKDDTFIPLETRTSIANQEQADLFVSIHANSSHDPDARGVETYYLNFTSSAEALDVAARENAASDKSIHELQDLVKKIALKEKIEESREFASNVQRALHSGLAAKSPGLRDRGVKKAPFVVLIGANMPSILAEISFVSNPGDERRLRTPEYRQRIAESLYRGISKYASGLSGVKVASKIDKSEGQ